MNFTSHKLYAAFGLSNWHVTSPLTCLSHYSLHQVPTQGCCLRKRFGSPLGSQNKKLGARGTFPGAHSTTTTTKSVTLLTWQTSSTWQLLHTSRNLKSPLQLLFNFCLQQQQFITQCVMRQKWKNTQNSHELKFETRKLSLKFRETSNFSYSPLKRILRNDIFLKKITITIHTHSEHAQTNSTDMYI